MRKYIIFLFCGILCAAGCTKDEVAGGTAGPLTWSLNKDGTLTISGTGEMPNYRVSPTEILPYWFVFRNDITSVIIGDSVNNIGDYAFFRCEKITTVTMGNSISAIGTRTFSGCRSLSSVIIPNSVTTIGDDAFSGCNSLTSMIIPNSVADMGNAIFYGCESLTYVTIGHSVTSIGDVVFSDCSSLKSVTIGNSVTSIGREAFRKCTDLTEIINHQAIPQKITKTAFESATKTGCTLFVPAGSVEAYRAADVWEDFKNIVAHTN